MDTDALIDRLADREVQLAELEQRISNIDHVVKRVHELERRLADAEITNAKLRLQLARLERVEDKLKKAREVAAKETDRFERTRTQIQAEATRVVDLQAALRGLAGAIEDSASKLPDEVLDSYDLDHLRKIARSDRKPDSNLDGAAIDALAVALSRALPTIAARAAGDHGSASLDGEVSALQQQLAEARAGTDEARRQAEQEIERLRSIHSQQLDSVTERASQTERFLRKQVEEAKQQAVEKPRIEQRVARAFSVDGKPGVLDASDGGLAMHYPVSGERLTLMSAGKLSSAIGIAYDNQLLAWWRDEAGALWEGGLDRSASKIQPATAPPAAGRGPAGYLVDGTEGRYLYFVDDQGSVHLMRGGPAGWYHHAVGDMAEAPAAAGAVRAWFWAKEGSHHVCYRTAAGAVYEVFCIDGANWYFARLDDQAGAPIAAGDPVGFAIGDEEFVCYSDANGAVIELHSSGKTWHLSHPDLPAAGGPISAAAVDGVPWLAYRAASGQVVVAKRSGGHWYGVTAASAAACAENSPVFVVATSHAPAFVYQDESAIWVALDAQGAPLA